MAWHDFFWREMQALRPGPRGRVGSKARERVHMQGEGSLAAARARWAKPEPENLQHVQGSRRSDRRQQTKHQSAQTRKLRLRERVRRRYSSKLRGYATKPVRPIQTSYARKDGCSSANSTCTECPNPQVTLAGWGMAAIQHRAVWLRRKARSTDPNELRL